jgi:hypothetical protein
VGVGVGEGGGDAEDDAGACTPAGVESAFPGPQAQSARQINASIVLTIARLKRIIFSSEKSAKQ